MSMHDIKKTFFTSAVACLLVLSSGTSFASGERERGRDARAFDSETVKDLLASRSSNSGSWRIPADLGSEAGINERLGTLQEPLKIHDSAGTWIGDAYKVHSSGRYVGLLIVKGSGGQEGDVSSEFYKRAWPLDRPSLDFRLSDLENPLLEPQFRLVYEEDRFVLTASGGLREQHCVQDNQTGSCSH